VMSGVVCDESYRAAEEWRCIVKKRVQEYHMKCHEESLRKVLCCVRANAEAVLSSPSRTITFIVATCLLYLESLVSLYRRLTK